MDPTDNSNQEPLPPPPGSLPPPSAASDPASRFLEIAVAAPPATPSSPTFKPTDTHRKLAETLFESGAQTFVELAEKSGISRTTLWRIAADPEAVKWVVAHSTKAAEMGLGLVHARLLQLALTSRSPSAVELYLRRFDPDFRTASPTSGGMTIHAQVAQVANMSPQELERFIEAKRRKEGLHGTPSNKL